MDDGRDGDGGSDSEEAGGADGASDGALPVRPSADAPCDLCADGIGAADALAIQYYRPDDAAAADEGAGDRDGGDGGGGGGSGGEGSGDGGGGGGSGGEGSGDGGGDHTGPGSGERAAVDGGTAALVDEAGGDASRDADGNAEVDADSFRAVCPDCGDEVAELVETWTPVGQPPIARGASIASGYLAIAGECSFCEEPVGDAPAVGVECYRAGDAHEGDLGTHRDYVLCPHCVSVFERFLADVAAADGGDEDGGDGTGAA